MSKNKNTGAGTDHTETSWAVSDLSDTVDTQQKVIAHLSSRLGQLTDQVTTLELELSSTQERIQKDIRQVVEMIRKQ
jgi:predicted RNase H-like nuclease (RuvC/YqgF family)